MTLFTLNELRNASVWKVYRMRETIDLDPVYQREGDIWTDDKRQLLIDTILNRFDVPKIYLHKFASPRANESSSSIEYAVIDGKQRLSAIFDFIDGAYTTSEDFEFLHDDSVNAKKLTYADLSQRYPELKTDFDSFTLNIVTIETEETELIEDLFSRLNEAVPLNAAEKRNAWGGPMPNTVRVLAANQFFTAKIPFSNRRYRHLDIASKFIMAIDRDEIVDTKKAYLDRYFRDNSDRPHVEVQHLEEKTQTILARMNNVFIDRDPLLRSVGMIMIYFHLFRLAQEKNVAAILSRHMFETFENDRIENRKLAAVDITKAIYELLEFDRYTQSPNDAVAMKYRLAVFDELALGGELGLDLP